MRNSKISIVKFLILGIAMLMLGNTNMLAQVSVSLPTITRASGSPDESINLTVGSLTGQNVTAFQFNVYYNKSVVYLTGASTTGLSMTGSTAPTVNADTANGVLRVAWAQATAISGSGTLITIQVHYRGMGASALSFVNPQNSQNTFLFNAGAPAAATTDGSVTIPATAVTFGTLNAHVGDTVLIPITTSSLANSDNVTAFQFNATFNQNVLKLINYQTTGTMSAGGTASFNANNTNGTVSVAWASASNITGSGTLIYLKGVVLAAGTSTQAFTSFMYNAGTPAAAALSGTLTATTIVTYSVSGIVSYDNGSNTAVPNAVVTLTPASGTPVTVTTDATGSYSFGNLLAGTYTVSVTKNSGWGGVNAADALQAARYYQNLVTLDTVQVLAGDVNNSGSVNSSDALSIIQRYVGIISSFTKQDWTFFPASNSITITNASITNNIKALATGDINASLSPIAKASTMGIVSSGELNVKPGTSFEIPISVSSEMQLGSISLKLTYPQTLAEYDGISVIAGANIISNVKDGVITLAWADLSGGNEPLSLNKNSVIAKLRFTANNNAEGKFAFNIQPGSEFTDVKGNSLSSSGILAPEVNFSQVPTEFTLKQNYPNPFNPSTSINYSIPETGNVTLSIYNVTGQEVVRLVNGVENAGSHNIVWNASNLSSGIYFYRLDFNGSNRKYSDVKSMVLLK